MTEQSDAWTPEQVAEFREALADAARNWHPRVLPAADHCAAADELAKINEILREHGFEYPLGSRGVQDLADGYRVRQEELHERDPEHWAAMS